MRPARTRLDMTIMYAVHDAEVMSRLPPPMRAAYRDEWAPRFATLRRWEATPG